MLGLGSVAMVLVLKSIGSEIMTEKEMFEQSFNRPKNFFHLSQEKQWEIDRQLGILDWVGEGLLPEDIKRFKEHYK